MSTLEPAIFMICSGLPVAYVVWSEQQWGTAME
jgi:hypothetical protein